VIVIVDANVVVGASAVVGQSQKAGVRRAVEKGNRLCHRQRDKVGARRRLSVAANELGLKLGLRQAIGVHERRNATLRRKRTHVRQNRIGGGNARDLDDFGGSVDERQK
jgi:hypothetical protein